MFRRSRGGLLAVLLLFSCNQRQAAAPSQQGAQPSAQPAPAPAPVAPPAKEAAVAKPDGHCRVPSLPEALVGPGDAALGWEGAPVTLVVIDDFDHVFGRKLSRTLRSVTERYGPEKVRLVWKNNPLPFHVEARRAALVGQAVLALKGSAAFWRYHDEVFHMQSADPSDDLAPEDVTRAAAGAGLDEQAVDAAMEDPALRAKLEADLSLVQALGVTGAPATFINGQEISGAQRLEKFTELIDDELAATGGGRPSPDFSCERTRLAIAARGAPKPPAPRAPPDTTTVWNIPLGNSPRRGGATALVTIVEFGGYQDPFSGRIEPTLGKLLARYGDRLRIVWKDHPLPFHTRGDAAAELAREALARQGPAGFWAMHDRLLLQPIGERTFQDAAAAARLDWPSAEAAIKRRKYAREIDADSELAEAFGASGTPHFFINGRRLVGAQPIEDFQKIIDEEIVHAEALIAGGQRPAGLYESIVARGRPPEPPKRIEVSAPSPGAPSRGNARAKVVIQEFAGFQDPFSARVEATLEELLRSYGGRVRLVWRDKPLAFHRDGQLSAEAAAEAMAQKGPAAFWKFHNLLLSKQKEPDGLKQPALERYAAEQGLDVARFRDALATHRHAAAIAADIAAAESAGIGGTPSFAINGYLVTGAQNVRAFRRVIDRALAE
jgi:protein-disulfide isomerase